MDFECTGIDLFISVSRRRRWTSIGFAAQDANDGGQSRPVDARVQGGRLVPTDGD